MKQIIVRKRNFPLRISSVNVTKFAVSCGFGHITEEILNGKPYFLCSEYLPNLCTVLQSYFIFTILYGLRSVIEDSTFNEILIHRYITITKIGSKHKQRTI